MNHPNQKKVADNQTATTTPCGFEQKNKVGSVGKQATAAKNHHEESALPEHSPCLASQEGGKSMPVYISKVRSSPQQQARERGLADRIQRLSQKAQSDQSTKHTSPLRDIPLVGFLVRQFLGWKTRLSIALKAPE